MPSIATRVSASSRTLTLRLETMAYGGEAVGRQAGQVVFVNGGLPGELVRVQIVEERRRFVRATVIDVIEPSPDRVAPRCPHFGFDAAACGGCQWQHIAYEAQQHYKTALVREQLQRLGGVSDPPVRDIIPSPAVWAYRNHAQFRVALDGRPGFQAAQSHHVVPLNECQIIAPPLQEWLKTLPSLEQDNRRISVRCANTACQADGETTFVIKDIALRVSTGSFFQVNTSLIETLIEQVLQPLQLRGDETVLDAYCGVGLFSRFIAPYVRRVISVESSSSAAADFQYNLVSCDQVEFHSGLVEKVLPTLAGAIDAAVLDPPRAGCAPAVLEALSARPIDRVVYVSCDPSTLARDAKTLIGRGYRLLDVQPIDLFPHTYHIETIAWLQRSRERQR